MTRAILILLLTATTAWAGDPAPTGSGFYPREGHASWRGDCDGDGDADILDALLAARTAAGQMDAGTPLHLGGDCPGSQARCEAIFRGCDADGSGTIDPVDALISAQINVGLVNPGLELTVVNTAPFSPDPTGGQVDPHPLRDPLPAHPALGDVCLHYYLTTHAGGPASASVILEYSLLGGAPGSFLPATVGGSSSGAAEPARPDVRSGIVPDVTQLTARTIVWDSDADIPMAMQQARGQGDVVLRLRAVESLAPGAATEDEQVTLPFVLGNAPPSCTLLAPASGGFVGGEVPLVFDLWDDDLISTPWPTPPYPGTDLRTATIHPEFSTDGGARWEPMTEASSGSSGMAGLAMGTTAAPRRHTFVWDSTADMPGGNFELPIRLRVEHAADVFDGVATIPVVLAGSPCGGSSVWLINRPAPECRFISPAAGQTVSGNRTVSFELREPTGGPVDLVAEFSTDGGASWQLSTLAPGGSVAANPARGLASAAAPPVPPPFTPYTLVWASSDDVPVDSPVRLRLQVTGDQATSSCTTDLQVRNQPTCAIVAPTSGTHGGRLSIQLDLDDPGMDPVAAQFEYSTDLGMTFQRCTPAAGGSLPGNPTSLVATPAPGSTFVWDTGADVPDHAGVELRVLLEDAAGGTGLCTVGFDLDNRPSCLVQSPSGGVHAGVVPVVFDTVDPKGGPVDLTLHYSLDGGVTSQRATLAPGGSFASNPAHAVAPGAGQTMLWDTVADGLQSETGVLVFLEIGDGVTTSTCSTSFDVQNNSPPTCGGLTVSGQSSTVDVVLDTDDPDAGDVLDVTFEWSTDAGSSWNLATPAGWSLPPFHTNPALATTPGHARRFVWDVNADLCGNPAVELRATVTDSGQLSSTCTTQTQIDNAIEVSFEEAHHPATVRGEYAIAVSVRDPGVGSFEVRYAYSTNGTIYVPMTPASGGLPNPMSVVSEGTFQQLQFHWDSAADLPDAAQQACTLQVEVVDTSGPPGCTSTIARLHRVVENRVSCSRLMPVGGVQSGTVVVSWGTESPSGNPIDLDLQFRLPGEPFQHPTIVAGGTFSTPTATGVPAASLQNMHWDTVADSLADEANVEVQLTVTEGTTIRTCTTTFAVRNNRAPSCTMTGISGMPSTAGIGGDVTVDVDVADPDSGDSLDVAYEFSLDGGMTYAPMTPATASAITNPATGITPGSSLSFEWDSAADVLACESESCLLGASGGELIIDSGQTITVDTDTGTVTGSLPTSGDFAMAYDAASGSFNWDSIEIRAGGALVARRGRTNPLRLRALGNVLINGLIDVSAADGDSPEEGASGPGGGHGGAAYGGTGGSPVPGGGGPSLIAAGGGAHAMDGGAPYEDVGGTPSYYGQGGTAYASLPPLIGGAGGGGAMDCFFCPGLPSPGGGGGGAVSIVTPGTLTVGSTGRIDASGGLGGNSTIPSGGGAGGGIELLGGMMPTVLGTLDISGGRGGQSSSFSSSYGGDGSIGRTRIALTDCITPNVDVRVTVSDGAASGECAATGLTVTNCPTVAIRKPTSSAVVPGMVTFRFDVTNPGGNPVQLFFDYDNGGGWHPASDAGGGSVTGSPSSLLMPGSGLSWVWDASNDVGVASGIAFRVEVLDVGADMVAGTMDDGARVAATVTGLDIDPCGTFECHYQHQLALGEAFDFGMPTATALGLEISLGVKDTSMADDHFCSGQGSCTSPVRTSCGPAFPPTAISCGDPSAIAGDHVYKVVIPAGIGQLLARLDGATFNPVISIYDCRGHLQNCGSPSPSPTVVTPGETYYLVIDGVWTGETGSYELVIAGL